MDSPALWPMGSIIRDKKEAINLSDPVLLTLGSLHCYMHT